MNQMSGLIRLWETYFSGLSPKRNYGVDINYSIDSYPLRGNSLISGLEIFTPLG